MKTEISVIIDSAIQDDIWNEIFMPETEIVINDIAKQTLDYRNHAYSA